MTIWIMLGILIGVLVIAFIASAWDLYDNCGEKKYMLIINSQVRYFKCYREVTDYIDMSDVAYQLYIKDKGEYVFLMSYSPTE